jgi:hypothetical protein
VSASNPDLVRLGTFAKRYFLDVAPGVPIERRQFAGFIAKDAAAHHALLPSPLANFDDLS